MKKDITTFKEQILEPAIFASEYYINSAFPNMDFRRKGEVYISPKKRDGSAPKTPRPDKTYIAQRNGNPFVDENGTIGAISITQYYIEQNNCDFITAIKALASIAGIENQIPRFNKELEEKRQREFADNRAAAKIMQEALFSGTDAAALTLQYIRGRNWDDEEIKNDLAKFGHIDKSIFETLPQSVKDKLGHIDLNRYCLAIPIQSGGEIIGFKFRLTDTPKNEGEPRYKNSKFLPKKNNLGMIPTTATPYQGVLIIVEGELDAIHAKVKGLENVASTLGGKVTPEQIEAATERGFRHFIFAYDADEAGKQYFADTAKNAAEFGASVYFLDITDLGVKDIDEYLSGHDAGELINLINSPEKCWHYVKYTTYSLINQYYQKYNITETGVLPDIARQDFINEIGDIIISTKSADKQIIFDLLEANKDWLRIDPKGIEAGLSDREKEAAEKKQLETQKKLLGEINTALTKNEISTAKKLIHQLATATDESQTEREFIKALTPVPLATLVQGITDGIPSGYYFRDQYGHQEELTFNTGLTFICAPTSHGKTSALNNIALNEAKRIAGQSKTILYFSYEVATNRIALDLLNTQINDENICEGMKYGNEKPLNEFRKAINSGSNNFTGRHFNNYAIGKQTLEGYLNTGTLRIFDTAYKVGELLKLIDFVYNNPGQFGEISMILIDYVQLLYKEGKFTLRTEELKEIVNDIKDFATARQLPIILAAQFNRKAVSPASATLDNIGEAGDIERIADTIISLINLDRFSQQTNISKEDKEESIKLLNDAGLKISDIVEDYQKDEIKGKIFARILKRRYGRSFISAVLNWNGTTKHIAQNKAAALTGSSATETEAGNLWDDIK